MKNYDYRFKENEITLFKSLIGKRLMAIKYGDEKPLSMVHGEVAFLVEDTWYLLCVDLVPSSFDADDYPDELAVMHFKRCENIEEVDRRMKGCANVSVDEIDIDIVDVELVALEMEISSNGQTKESLLIPKAIVIHGENARLYIQLKEIRTEWLHFYQGEDCVKQAESEDYDNPLDYEEDGLRHVSRRIYLSLKEES